MKKFKFFLFTMIVFSILGIIGCVQGVDPIDEDEQAFIVEFKSLDSNASISAELNGKPFKSGNKVVKNSKIHFKVTLKSGYEITKNSWKGLNPLPENLSDFDLVIKKDVNLSLKVEKKEVQVEMLTVKFNTNGGTPIADLKIAKDSLIDESKLSTTKTGYAFEGWYKEVDFKTKWDFAKDKVTENITLYANWEVARYEVKFDSQGGLAVDSQNIEHNQKVKRPADPVKTGENFLGWFTDKECIDGNEWNFDTPITGEKTLYAKWSTTHAKVEFDTAGGTKIERVIVKLNDPVNKPATEPTKEEYTFFGWYKEKEFTTEYDFTTLITKNITIYAKFVNNDNVCTVTFDSRDGSDVDPIKVILNTKATEPTPVPIRANYVFKGWYKEAECTTEWNFATDTVKGDMTLYAKWEGEPRTITFDSRDGSVVDPITVPYDTKATEPPAPTTPNEEFLGWFTDEACTAVNEFNFDTPITENIILYAKWNSPVPKDLNLVYNAGTTSLKIEGENFTADNVKNITLDDGSFNFDVNARTIDGTTVCNIPYQMPTGKKTVTLTYRNTVLTLDVYAYTIDGSGMLKSCTPAPDGVFKIPEGVKSTKIDLFNAGWSPNPQSITPKSTMTKLVFPKGFETVGARSFMGCTKLAEIVFNDELEEIGVGAFLGTAVTKVVLPPSVKTIQYHVFAHCPNLETFVFQSNITIWGTFQTLSSEGPLSDMFKFKLPDEGKPFDVEIREAVTKLGVGVFSNTKINNIDIYGNALTEVGDKILLKTTVEGKIRIHDVSDADFKRIKDLIKAKATHLTGAHFEHVQ